MLRLKLKKTHVDIYAMDSKIKNLFIMELNQLSLLGVRHFKKEVRMGAGKFQMLFFSLYSNGYYDIADLEGSIQCGVHYPAK